MISKDFIGAKFTPDKSLEEKILIQPAFFSVYTYLANLYTVFGQAWTENQSSSLWTLQSKCPVVQFKI